MPHCKRLEATVFGKTELSLKLRLVSQMVVAKTERHSPVARGELSANPWLIKLRNLNRMLTLIVYYDVLEIKKGGDDKGFYDVKS